MIIFNYLSNNVNIKLLIILLLWNILIINLNDNRCGILINLLWRFGPPKSMWSHWSMTQLLCH